MIFWTVLATLAVYRLSYMVANEDGPFDLCTKLRTWAYLRKPGGLLERGLNCPLCVSFWLAWPAAYVLMLFPWETLAAYVLMALGIAGAVLVLHTVIHE